MAAITEAACLLESGATYPRRCLLRNDEGKREPIFAGFKRGGFSLYFGDAPIVHFDLEGRWQRAFIEDVHYLKGLDSVTQAIDRVRVGENMVLKRRTLSYDETVDLDASIRNLALQVASTLDSEPIDLLDPPATVQRLTRDDFREFLERIMRWDSATWFAHREKFVAVYPRLPFLPPDCPNALSLVSHAEGFERHVLGVLALLGRALDSSRIVYLADADALRRPFEEIARNLEVVNRHLTGRELQAFLDEYSSPRLTRDEWSKLHERGLGRVSLGVGSGSTAIRAALGYSWLGDDLVETVAAIKAAGIGVSLIVPVGAGGQTNVETHKESTAALLDRLALGSGDLVSLLMADDLAQLGSSHRCEPGRGSLTEPEREASLARLKDRLGPGLKTRKVKVAPFRLEKQGL